MQWQQRVYKASASEKELYREERVAEALHRALVGEQEEAEVGLNEEQQEERRKRRQRRVEEKLLEEAQILAARSTSCFNFSSSILASKTAPLLFHAWRRCASILLTTASKTTFQSRFISMCLVDSSLKNNLSEYVH